MDHSSLGIVITTFGATPYVHLTLETVRRMNSGARVFVVDDASGDQRLWELCKAYGVDFATSASRRGHMRGDLAGIIQGYRWAVTLDLSLLVKLSRRFIPVNDGFSELLSSFIESPFATASAPCLDIGFPFRSEAFALRLNAWEQVQGIRFLEAFLKSGRTVYTEVLLYHIASAVEGQMTGSSFFTAEVERYYQWRYLGKSRRSPNSNYLWHESNSTSNYADLAKKLDLPYGIDDFTMDF